MVSSKDIYRALRMYFTNYTYKLENSYVFSWESDFFCISPDRGYMIEVEVKVSRSDFRADFKKDKHELFTRCHAGEKIRTLKTGLQDWQTFPELGKIQVYSGINYERPPDVTPNQFYYAAPPGIIKPEQLPPYAGLIIIERSSFARIEKRAPFLHKQKNLIKKRGTLLDKFHWLAVELQRNARHENFNINYSLQNEKKYLKILKHHGINEYSGIKFNDSDDNLSGTLELYTRFLFKKLKIEMPTSEIYKMVEKYVGKLPDPVDETKIKIPPSLKTKK